MPAFTFQNDRWLRLVGIPLLCVVYVVSAGHHLQPFTVVTAKKIGFAWGGVVLVWYVARALLFYFRRRYPAKHQQGLRRLVSFTAGMAGMLVLERLLAVGGQLLLHGTLAGYPPAGQAASITFNKMTISLSLFGFDLVKAAIATVFFQVLYEVLFSMRDSTLTHNRLQQAEKEKEKLRAENLQSQLDALKQQVNPHFLFNSLNILDSLIDEDAPQARLFLEQLSTVYRYLLRSNSDSHLVDLGSELDFIHSYFHLLKTRHGAGLHLDISVPDACRTRQLPPLTLQLLVENAVKHNIILPEQPLHIRIEAGADEWLVVRNNLQRKTTRVPSNRVGLANIAMQYRLLGGGEVAVEEDGRFFTVRLPLIRRPQPAASPAKT